MLLCQRARDGLVVPHVAVAVTTCMEARANRGRIDRSHALARVRTNLADGWWLLNLFGFQLELPAFLSYRNVLWSNWDGTSWEEWGLWIPMQTCHWWWAHAGRAFGETWERRLLSIPRSFSIISSFSCVRACVHNDPSSWLQGVTHSE
jgi:hypothetical protein